MGLLFLKESTVNKYMIQFINWDWLDYSLQIRYTCWQLSHFTIVRPLKDIPRVFFSCGNRSFLACLTKRFWEVSFQNEYTSLISESMFRHERAHPDSSVTWAEVEVWKVFQPVRIYHRGELRINVSVATMFACSLCHSGHTLSMRPRDALPGSTRRRTVSVLCFIRVILPCRMVVLMSWFVKCGKTDLSYFI